MKVNFGGFVPVSTVDWRGRAVCTVFFRGCPADCYYCHNRSIREGEDMREVAEIARMIDESLLLISGVVFSGGEATMQKEGLLALAEACRKRGLAVGLQTNGMFPATLQALLDRDLVDMVALDLKTRWERYDELLAVPAVDRVKHSLALCTAAAESGDLEHFEVVVTLFRGWEDDLAYIAPEVRGGDLVLQQGVYGTIPPLTREELLAVADTLSRQVAVRTREDGEVPCDGLGRRQC
ncbi:anaerobic ribonucleoside-triphosphate reductase activating protein [Methanoculleus sp. FWC-SCC1]|uniref:Anaerobic ribonucleoside-triphosphate reductase activating protein n=1 Tax=Methanoculleus frigidifontis TaxID=2584085 RepID=A0ABT8M921_9EURY|nr:anaerobic ribonucleoside-triphosphate reductase activating protein [Methanoculleus sp. FWC-SCC1]MDN7024432.1 anaerobic ribonucleoside-triphosphate reductase activating protein [Methanoculleus sp. FWC-SCC1]